ncbi:MAG: TonB-dependent receptor [Alphaproteobacteria bacterium]|nr:TonB-dependent receptor [Alphaproteobacteria bacterium]MBU6471764.1 TonB-dependent receptor [Alphaproteobacteria bacterium]MDE2014680.1 TonB-dependent receptor [Alphaproteobacteria bacterium]MDE2074701.1 TonB-dependent receptor [Alphaproteobacteria bacterium]
MEQVVVTGSLISRPDYNAESPISTLSSQAISAAGQPSLDVVMGQMPQFAGSQGAAEVGDAQGSVGFSGGQSLSDLRGLGANRSLVLMDGRRLMPSSPDGSIDLNTIPKAMIQSVEVVTGGASATYGSDAVAGVVNFKLKNHFSGLELDVQHGATTRDDGATNDISALIGGDFAGTKGHAVLALEYSDRAAVAGSSRPFFANIRQLARPPEGIIAPGSWGGGAPTIAAVNNVLSGYSGTTPISGSGNYLGAIGINTDGSMFTMGAAPNCAQNYKGLGTYKGANISPNCANAEVALGQYFAVQVPLHKYNAFATADYNVGEHVTVYGQFNFSESSALDQTGPGSTKPSVPLIVPLNSPFVTGNAALQTLLGSFGTPTTGPLVLTKLMTAFGNRVETYTYDVWQATGGAKGDIPGTSLTWDVYASYGRSLFTNVAAGDVSLSAVNSILNGTANYQGNTGNCVGYAWNPLGNNPVSAGCMEYAGRTDHSTNTLTQWLFQGTVQGPLFTLPAGDVRFAAGADYRKANFDYQPDSVLALNDTLAYGQITPAGGTQKVAEFFGELLVPVLTNQPFAEELSLDLGYRYSKYDTFSGKSTWKADVSWQPIDQVRFRGGYSVAIRAPSLYDLYGPSITQEVSIGVTPSAGDPCDVNSVFRTGANGAKVAQLCQAQGVPAALVPGFTYGSASAPNRNGSNAALQPETAHTWSIGMVFTPSEDGPLSGFKASVDYYNIEVANAIGQLGNTDILTRCFNADGVSNPSYTVNNAYCQRITRDPATGSIKLIQSGQFNFQTLTLDGIDTQLGYSLPITDASSLSVDTVISYLNSYKVAGLLGSPTLDYAGSIGFGLDSGTQFGGDISHPHWKANTAFTYAYGPFSGTLRWRFIGPMVHADLVANPKATTPGVPAYHYFDFDAHYKINDNFTLGAGINNIFDKGPPFVSAASLTTDASTYDVIGRSYHVSLQAKF